MSKQPPGTRTNSIPVAGSRHTEASSAAASEAAKANATKNAERKQVPADERNSISFSWIKSEQFK
ncbi:hypothetical protein [Thauera sp.]|uniref:hypothetical protein n=1 Tax=Thauera sp. TaxID=1905334 RepID=UPI002D1F9A8C|nr:hypothetical protein [Thauera sp.]